MIHPYVGVTGVSNINESRLLRGAFFDAKYSSFCSSVGHQAMAGILVSENTLNGKKQNRRYPKMEKLTRMLRHLSGCYGVIHYSTRNTNTLADQVERAFDYIYEYNVCRALQLNIPYPPIDQMEKIREKMPELEIIFAASKAVLEDKKPKDVAKSILPYKDFINYVLIDPSGGRGEEFDIEHSSRVHFELKDHLPFLITGFAGGFTPQNVKEKIARIKDKIKTSEFCIDVEAGVRDKIGPEFGNDIFNINKAREFLLNTCEVFP